MPALPAFVGAAPGETPRLLTLSVAALAEAEEERLAEMIAMVERGALDVEEAARALAEEGPRTLSDVLRYAMETEQLVEFSYTNFWDPRRGVRQSVQAEPYEVKPHPASGREVLYAYHLNGPTQGIHSFRWDGIEAAVVVEGAAFTPRWPTVPGSV